MDDRKARMAELERRLRELLARMPKHSVPPSMLIELEDLEEELAQLRATSQDEQEDT